MSIIKSRARRKQLQQPSTPKLQNEVFDPFREFKGDRMQLWIARAFYHIREHKLPYVTVLSLVLMLLFTTLGYTAWSQHIESKSQISFHELLQEPTMNFTDGAPEIAVEKLAKYTEAFSHTDAYLRSQVYRLHFLAKAKKWGEAGELCLDLAKQLATPELRAYFYFRAGLYLEMAGNYRSAEQAYKSAGADIAKKNSLKATALFNQGRMLVTLEQKEQAQEVFKEILSYDRSAVYQWLVPATIYLLELQKQNKSSKDNHSKNG